MTTTLDVTEFFSDRGGGVRQHLAAKRDAFQALGHRQRVVAPGPDPAPPLHDPSVRRIGGPSLPYDPSYHLFLRLDRLAREVRKEQPDVLEIHSPYLAALGALALPRAWSGLRTMVWHADFIDTYLRPPLETWCSSRVARGLVEPLWTLVRAEAARCDAVFVATRSQQEKLENHGLTNVVRNRFGVAKEYFRPEARDEQLRAHFSGGDPTQKILVAIGRMAVEKHWDVIFDAYEEIARTENVALVVLGDGPEKAQIERRAAALKNVFVRGFEGDRKKLAAILASSDLLLHGCPYETFGLGVAEALACGVSAALPAAGGTLEFQGPGSVVHYPALSAPAAAEAARSLLRQDPRELRSRAVENVTRIRSEREHFAEQLSWYAALKEDRFAAHSSRP